MSAVRFPARYQGAGSGGEPVTGSAPPLGRSSSATRRAVAAQVLDQALEGRARAFELQFELAAADRLGPRRKHGVQGVVR